MEKKYFNILTNNLNLHKNEALAYEALIEKGALSASDIGKVVDIGRGNVYAALESLEKKGLVEVSEQTSKKMFQAAPPDNLQSLIETQEQNLQQNRESLTLILPKLKTLHQFHAIKPTVRFYDDIESIKRAYEESLDWGKEILAYVRVKPEWDDQLGTRWWNSYYKKRVSKKIFVRSIVPDTPQNRDYQRRDKEQYRKTLLISAIKYPFVVEKNIIENKVMFISLNPKKLIVTIIEHDDLAQTERALFEFAWDSALQQQP